MYRFVHVAELEDPGLRDEFLSDAENGMTPFFKRERRYPELLDGMSMYGSGEAAAKRWGSCSRIAAERGEPVQIGDYIAEVRLAPGQGFDIEDLNDEDEHLTIWGDPDRLVAAVCRIYAPTMDEG